MKTVTYEAIKLLAADFAGVPRGKLSSSEATLLRTYFAAELPDLWNAEPWPELCDHLETVTLDANNCFSLREGDADEIGEIRAVLVGGDPRLTSNVSRVPKEQVVRLDNRVNVLATVTGAVWVDWQTPVPDLLDTDLDATLDDYELPARFKLPLAARGAALLVAEKDPTQAGVLRGLANQDLLRQAQQLTAPWWRA